MINITTPLPISATERKVPRISVNKLAEYLETNNASRRRQIVLDARTPSSFLVTRYKEAREAAQQFLISRNYDRLAESIDKIKSKPVNSNFQLQDKDCSLESLEHLKQLNLDFLNGFEVSVFKGSKQFIEIAGVNISVAPDLIITKHKGATSEAGALKLHIIKSDSLSVDAQRQVGVLLHSFTQKYLVHKTRTACFKQSISIDVFRRRVVDCPASFISRMRRIEAGCSEISLYWNSL